MAQPRPRAVSMGGKARMYNPKTAKDWKRQIGLSLMEVISPEYRGYEGAVEVHSTFLLKRPKSHYGTGRNNDRLKDNAPAFCLKKPDLDNLQKAVFDAITDHKIWKDDSQVIKETTEKLWADNQSNGLLLNIKFLT